MAKKAGSKTQLTQAKSGLRTKMIKLGGEYKPKQVVLVRSSRSNKASGIYTGTMVLRSLPELVAIVSKGVPVSDAKRLLSHYKVESEKVIRYFGDSSAKFRNRKPSDRLQLAQSDRLVRIARLMAAAEALYEGNAEAARRWMESPNSALGGEAPLEYARTEVGAREVEQLIGRLEHGVFS